MEGTENFLEALGKATDTDVSEIVAAREQQPAPMFDLDEATEWVARRVESKPNMNMDVWMENVRNILSVETQYLDTIGFKRVRHQES